MINSAELALYGHTTIPREYRFEVIEADTYAVAVHTLGQACEREGNPLHPKYRYPDGREVFRPFTIKELIQKRLDHYSDGSSRAVLWNEYLDTCTGIAYKAAKRSFKIVSMCESLIGIAKDFHHSSMLTVYDSLDGIVVDPSRCKYGQDLTKEEIGEHEGWIAVLEDDRELLLAYRDVVFSALQERNSKRIMPEKAMAFHITPPPSIDCLRAGFVSYLDNNSVFNGNNDLNNWSGILKVTPEATDDKL